MDNFNSIQNMQQFKLAQNKAGLVNTPQNNPSQTVIQNQNLNQQPLPMPQQQNINPSLMLDFQTIKMDNETILKYLQNLMNLPKTIDKFINQLNSNQSNKQILNILIENMINTKALGELLNQNSTQAINKLLQTISTSLKTGVEDVSQLKEVLNILTAIQTNTTLSNNSLKELLLLYIPLNHQVFDKEIDLSNFSEEAGGLSLGKLNIFFETINFSNILCTINEDNNNLFIDLYSSEDFPKDRFNNIIQTLAKEININPYFEFKKSPENNNSNKSQNFKIVSEETISTNVLIFSHIIIKTIFKIDNDFNTI